MTNASARRTPGWDMPTPPADDAPFPSGEVSTYVIGVDLDGSQPEIWRRIAVPSDLTLDHLLSPPGRDGLDRLPSARVSGRPGLPQCRSWRAGGQPTHGATQSRQARRTSRAGGGLPVDAPVGPYGIRWLTLAKRDLGAGFGRGVSGRRPQPVHRHYVQAFFVRVRPRSQAEGDAGNEPGPQGFPQTSRRLDCQISRILSCEIRAVQIAASECRGEMVS